MSKHKKDEYVKQHIVPISYLKRFARKGNHRGYYIGVRRITDSGEVKLFRSNIRDIGYVCNYYDVEKYDDPKYWEHYFSRELEPLYGNDLNRIISKVVLKTNGNDVLEDGDKTILAKMICFQFARVPAFVEEVADAIGYDVYFEGEDITTPLAYIAGTNNIVSAEIELFSGRLVLLPSILTGELFHNKEEWKEKEKNFINKLLELNRKLLFSTDEYIPTWVTECFIPGEKDCIREAEITKEKIIEFEQRLKFQTTIIKDKQQYKKLLYSQGKSLELIVQKVFEELGFTIKDKLENRDDLIAEYDNIRIVCEVKGLTKSAAEKNAAQLEKWVSTYIENNEVVPKGILVVNGFKDKPLDQRVEEVFPDQMIPYCVGRGHLLLTTTQLLCLYLDCKEHEDIKDDVIKEMLNCVGRYPKYMNYRDYIINEK